MIPQKPIGKPSGTQSLFALRKLGTTNAVLPLKQSAPIPLEIQRFEPKKAAPVSQELGLMTNQSLILALQRKQKSLNVKWHAPWKLHRVIQGHQGWVRTIDVDPSNEWFVTGSNDRMIKIWDLATGILRLSLTGHTHNIRAVRVHPQFKYLFSAGEDNMVKCWDLEQNKVIRHYHGHLSGVYCMDVHPTEPYLFTGARDASVRMWDVRTKECVHVLGGHTHTVQCVAAQGTGPELISGSTDATVRLWDIRTAGRSYKTLTHHKKGIRAITTVPEGLFGKFSTAGADQIKVWKSPEGDFERNLGSGDDRDRILNCTVYRDDGLFIAGGDDGMLHMMDWESGREFQQIASPPQPGSLQCENGIFDMKFDFSGNRLITAECDKSIKMYRVDETAINPNALDEEE